MNLVSFRKGVSYYKALFILTVCSIFSTAVRFPLTYAELRSLSESKTQFFIVDFAFFLYLMLFKKKTINFHPGLQTFPQRSISKYHSPQFFLYFYFTLIYFLQNCLAGTGSTTLKFILKH